MKEKKEEERNVVASDKKEEIHLDQNNKYY